MPMAQTVMIVASIGASILLSLFKRKQGKTQNTTGKTQNKASSGGRYAHGAPGGHCHALHHQAPIFYDLVFIHSTCRVLPTGEISNKKARPFESGLGMLSH